MKEKFRDWNPKGELSIKYKNNAGVEGLWTINQQTLLSQIVAVVAAYKEQGLKLTNRQLYYQLVTENIIPNAEAVYKRICTFLTDARYGGKIDWDDIEDRARNPQKHIEFESIKERIEVAIANFRLPRWSDQDYYVELYCEKQALEGVFKPVADKFHIYFGANKGYSSASTMYDLAQRIKEQIQNGKRCVILYFGDHDPSGLDMVRDIHKRICEFLVAGDEYIDIVGDIEDNPYFQILPLALNMEQIRKYNPPPNPAKITDPRAKWYIKEYGNKSWELDALKPEVLIRLASNGVLNFLDADKYNRWIKLETKQTRKLKEFGDSLVEEE